MHLREFYGSGMGCLYVRYIVIEQSYSNHYPWRPLLLEPSKTYLLLSFNRPGLALVTIPRVPNRILPEGT
jgi:hypothetical protein